MQHSNTKFICEASYIQNSYILLFHNRNRIVASSILIDLCLGEILRRQFHRKYFSLFAKSKTIFCLAKKPKNQSYGNFYCFCFAYLLLFCLVRFRIAPVTNVRTLDRIEKKKAHINT